MVKKFNNDEICIKGLLGTGVKPAEIMTKYQNKCRALKITYHFRNYITGKESNLINQLSEEKN